MKQFFVLNGKAIEVPDAPCLLIDFLRDALFLTGTKAACREGDCGSCQILVCADISAKCLQYTAQTSCLVRTHDLIKHHVITIEGLSSSSVLNPVQRILEESGASQCGFCSPGLVVAPTHWLMSGPKLTVAEGEAWINGNLCRCTGYMGQRRAIQCAVETFSETLLNSSSRINTLVNLGVLPEFAVRRPILTDVWDLDIQQAISAESRTSTNKTFLGGGTDLYLQRTIAEFPAEVCSCFSTDLPLKESADALLLNARLPIQTLANAIARTEWLPAFAQFNHLFASLPVRNRATLGGNLANASPIGDGITFLMALGALVITDLRVIPIEQFFKGYKQTDLQDGELIQWIQLPATVKTSFVYFEKVSRRSTTDIAVVNCAGVWRIEYNVVANVALVVGGASPTPVRLRALESALQGHSVDAAIEQLLTRYLQLALDPISDHRGSARYRRLLARQLILSQWQALALHQKSVLRGSNVGGVV